LERQGYAMFETHIYEELDSTNITAKTLANEGVRHGTAIIAKRQTRGRGRLGKEWFSGDGLGLYCSIIVRPRLSDEDYAKITLAAGLAVGEFIESYIARKIALKWPNDVLVAGKKICGILTESSPYSVSGFSYAVIGVGINVNHCALDFPENLRDASTSLFLETSNETEPVSLVSEIREKILCNIARLEQDEFPAILSQWKSRDYLYGRAIKCVGVDGKIISGVAMGPDAQGVLHIQGEDGIEREVLSGDLSLAYGRNKAG